MPNITSYCKCKTNRNKPKQIKSLYGNIFADKNCGLEKRRRRMLKKQKKNEKTNL